VLDAGLQNSNYYIGNNFDGLEPKTRRPAEQRSVSDFLESWLVSHGSLSDQHKPLNHHLDVIKSLLYVKLNIH
jgi:hypothetical protein